MTEEHLKNQIKTHKKKLNEFYENLSTITKIEFNDIIKDIVMEIISRSMIIRDLQWELSGKTLDRVFPKRMKDMLSKQLEGDQ